MAFPERGFGGSDDLRRLLEPAVVEHVWHTSAETTRITTPDGTIDASTDHRFLCGEAGDGDWQRVSQMQPDRTVLRRLAQGPGAAGPPGGSIGRWRPSPVTALEPVGVRDLIDIQTSTGTFFAAGLATHNCYAESLALRWRWHDWDNRTPRKTMSDSYWRQPLRWNRAAEQAGVRARVFCASLADIFDPGGPPAERDRLWNLIRETPHLDWQLLTKRPNLAQRFLPEGFSADAWPNVWLGCTAEDQENFDIRWPHLARVDAAVRFISYEPMVGPLRLTATRRGDPLRGWPAPDWVIVGGESGPGARRCDPRWARDIVEDCRTLATAAFFKQWGSYASNPLMSLCDAPEGSEQREEFLAAVKIIDPPEHGKGGALLDGALHRQFPRPAARAAA